MNKLRIEINTITEIHLDDLLVAVKTPHYVAVTPEIAILGWDMTNRTFEFGFDRYWDFGGWSLPDIMEDIFHLCLFYVEANPEATVTLVDEDDMYEVNFEMLPMLRLGTEI